MKCHSVAALWSPLPPSHHVTAAATTPVALFTGAADGTVLHWPLALASASPSPRPSSLLCAHAAAITSLCPLPSPASLPLWVGSPSLIASLPSITSADPRVAILCHAPDDGHRHVSALVVVDARTLAVLYTVFHGILSVGTPNAIAVSGGGDDAVSVVLADAQGRVQVMPVAEGAAVEVDPPRRLIVSSVASVASAELADERVEAVALSHDGKNVALVLKTRCLLKCVTEGVVLGEVSLLGTSLCKDKNTVDKVCTAGAFFLSSDEWDAHVSDDGVVVRNLVLWSNNGAVTMYRIALGSSYFDSEIVCEIPSNLSMQGEGLEVKFCWSNQHLVRVECCSYKVAGSLLWKPTVAIWCMDQFELSKTVNTQKPPMRKMLGEGGLQGEEFRPEPSHSQYNINRGSEVISQMCSLERYRGTVSSSMLLSEDSYAPYAVVYGFHNGDIEVIRFLNLSPAAAKFGGRGLYPHISERLFLGHKGAILCLAAHYMHAHPDSRNFHRALISGSLDCTVRVWDLDAGTLLSVMHHHVGSVKQIVLPPPWTYHPWDDCFLSVGEDGLVALVSLQTMRVERMFPGHPDYASLVAWDGVKGYIACLCKNLHSCNDAGSGLYIWDLKTGARERVINGTASQLAFEHFCRGISKNTVTGSILGGTTSASSLLVPIFEDMSHIRSHADKNGHDISSVSTNLHNGCTDSVTVNAPTTYDFKGKTPAPDEAHEFHGDNSVYNSGKAVSSHSIHNKKIKCPIKCSCPYPGIASLRFDLTAIMSTQGMTNSNSDRHLKDHLHSENPKEMLQPGTLDSPSRVHEMDSPSRESLEGCLLRFSLCFLHLWDVDCELDKLLVDEMQVCKPEGCHIATGVVGDKGSFTLMFPGKEATLELWKSSAEFCAMRSLSIISLAQLMIKLSRSCTNSSSALAAFYTRHFAEKVPDIKPPSLQLLVSFWQHPSEHVRMAARSLFHCAAPRSIPQPLRVNKNKVVNAPLSSSDNMNVLICAVQTASVSNHGELKEDDENVDKDDIDTANMILWLESFENQEWLSWIGGTSQDAVASNIIVAAALVVWYPSVVKAKLSSLVVSQLIKLVMSMNDRYSSTAAELLAEGMENTWKACLGAEITHFMSDILFQIECLSTAPSSNAINKTAVAITMREALVGTLLPSLAMADVTGFFGVIESQIWATSSDSPVHVASIKTIIRVVRGAPKSLVPYLDKAINYILHTMDPSNLIMRKACIISSMMALREMARVFPMVALNESMTKLAVGDAIGEIYDGTIRVYDIESVTKIRILDASGPPGLPSLLAGSSNRTTTILISVLSFSPDGEGLVAFSENGLMIRWWSLGSAWWERLSRSLTPIQCTKLIYVPPWEGFSPNSARLSIISSILDDKPGRSEKELGEADNLKLLLHNLDLSYRLHWIGGKTIKLTRHGQDLGTFQL
ncbi:Transducin/WD40 repeat-like superfamily protein [Zea mays]|uniref:Transducin/WD40 repeat-like superfamily protein n=1 Tax=Zea mays TaxID=4577 RepID=A0A1D6P0R4_MAIZE|nr:Transducin/WD40 repeat-like superfamily protein [Zea mays]